MKWPVSRTKCKRNLIKSCNSGILEMGNDVTFDNLELDAIELSKKCERPEIFVEKRFKRRSFFDEVARNSDIKETRLRFKTETLYNMLDTFSNQLKKLFKDFITVLQRFKVLDPTFLFRYLLVNVTKRYPSWSICMNQTQRNGMYYPSLNLVVSCTSRSCKMLSFRNFIKSVMFYIS